MRALLITVGSRGDAEPYISLAQSLRQAGCHVDLFLQKDLMHLSTSLLTRMESHNGDVGLVNIHELPFTQMDFYKYVGSPSHGTEPKYDSNPRIRFIGVVTDVIGELVLPCLPMVLKQCMNVVGDDHGTTTSETLTPKVIVTSSLARPLAMSVAEKINTQHQSLPPIKVCLIHLQPYVPTDRFPPFSHGADACVKRICAIFDREPSTSHKKVMMGDDHDKHSDQQKNYQIEECFSMKNHGDDDDNHDHAETEQYYWELEEFHHKFLEKRLNKTRAKFGLQPLPFDDNYRNALLGRDGGQTIIVNAFSNELVPSPISSLPSSSSASSQNDNDNRLDNTTTMYNVGALADGYIPHDWKPPQALVDFLWECQSNEDSREDEKSGTHGPPICIGFGSMPFDKVNQILDALEDETLLLHPNCSNNIILVGSVFVEHDNDHDDEEKQMNQKQQHQSYRRQGRVFAISSVPYAWLLPQCSLLVSHGGAGTVHVALRAGIPSVVVPFFGDQFFFANLLDALQLGVNAGTTLGDLTKEKLVSAIIRVAESSLSMNKKTRLVGETIRSCSKLAGVDKLVQILLEL
mmetsp:Transcript_19325/g.29788  ORF Transcript_19325/g.29788 Transcript_19325/m.29788 type:complete len:575 (+) Transcript_19325:145-1869(+)